MGRVVLLDELDPLRDVLGGRRDSPFAGGPRAGDEARRGDVEHEEVEARMVAWVIERAKLYMPRIGSLRVVRAWTGFRAATPDSLPIIGGRDGVDEPVIATGHEGLGLTTSLGTAELIAAILTGAPTPLDAAAYSASRDFGGHDGH